MFLLCSNQPQNISNFPCLSCTHDKTGTTRDCLLYQIETLRFLWCLLSAFLIEGKHPTGRIRLVEEISRWCVVPMLSPDIFSLQQDGGTTSSWRRTWTTPVWVGQRLLINYSGKGRIPAKHHLCSAISRTAEDVMDCLQRIKTCTVKGMACQILHLEGSAPIFSLCK